MTVQNTVVKNVYAGNGSTTVFPYTFALNTDDGQYVQVLVTDAEGVESETTNFTIDTDARSVTYPAVGDPLEAGRKLVLLRVLPNVQELNLESQGPFFAEDIEAELDRQVMMIQQLKEVTDRCVKAGASSSLVVSEMTIQEIYQARDDAEAAAAAAGSSANSAAGSASSAATNATTAFNAAIDAASSAADADTSAAHAANSAADADNSASVAIANAQSVIDLAADARGYAQDAADSASAASTSQAGAQGWANLAYEYTEPLRQAMLNSMFEYDSNQDLMVVENPLAAASLLWEVDANNDVMPAVLEIDGDPMEIL